MQGVGFRPFVYCAARDAGLAGWVRNGPDGVTLEVEGDEGSILNFLDELEHRPPPLARIDGIQVHEIESRGESSFAVVETEGGGRRHALVPADARLCSRCAAEMEDPQDRRYHYPFTVCTHCGPRFSLVRQLPYDREQTSMACFPLCDACALEYGDPGDSRFHTEPVCCPACGPKLWGQTAGGRTIHEPQAALVAARGALASGRILAFKGLGGFQLACDARNERACSTLRRRKGRASKPFAVMARDLDVVNRLVHATEADFRLLQSSRAPILLLPLQDSTNISGQVAPGLRDLGIMLPTTPLHVELFRDLPSDCLVMTSGNMSEEPICRRNREAVQDLSGLADFFLLHDRDIVRRVDDSVLCSDANTSFMLRRSRGWVPDPLPLRPAAPQPVLAVGGHLQTTAALAVEGQVFLSQHVGDLDTPGARAFHQEVVDGLLQFLDVEPQLILCDAHPDYPSHSAAKEWAQRHGVECMEVQHHLAHVAAVAVEHGCLPEPGRRCVGLALDGTGYGPDGHLWGGELLSFDAQLRWTRHAQLESLPLIGNEAAVREPWRVALSALVQAGREDLTRPWMASAPGIPNIAGEVLRLCQGPESKPPWPRSSGAGRIFEAAGSLCGLVMRNGYEGEAAIRFEALAERSPDAVGVWPRWKEEKDCAGLVFPSSHLLAELAERLLQGEDPAKVASGFHRTFCYAVVRFLMTHLPQGTDEIHLGGGCLANRLLRRGLAEELAAHGLQAYLPQEVPAGDGGLALGQAALGSMALTHGGRPQQETTPCA